MSTIKPILKYPGAKWLKADWIVSYFPKHVKYLEPFAGSAACFFSKEPVSHEILGDMNQSIVNLFRVIRERGDELAYLIEMTPWARGEYEGSYEQTGDQLEDARRFIVRCWQAHGARLGTSAGWRHVGTSTAKTTSLWKQVPGRILAVVGRLKDAEIECRPALELIARCNTSDFLIYADPPYVSSIREPHLYTHDMTDEEHITLLDALDEHPGPVVLSGYAHPLYDERLAHWYRVTMPSLAEKGNMRTEVLWLNQRAAGTQQLALFSNNVT